MNVIPIPSGIKIREIVISVLQEMFNDIDDHDIRISWMEMKKRHIIYVVDITPTIFGRIEAPDSVHPTVYTYSTMYEFMRRLRKELRSWRSEPLWVISDGKRDLIFIKVKY